MKHNTLHVPVFCVSVVCLYEIAMGLLQILGRARSNNIMYAVTGSFDNPGPYGGFLAVCVSILGAWLLSERHDAHSGLQWKLFYCVVYAVVVSALVMLPATQSRSALFALGCSAALYAIGNKEIRNRLKPTLKRYWAIIGIVLLLIGIGAYLFKKPSADGRIFMDRMCVRAMTRNGMNGVGRGHFGFAYGETQARYFQHQISENGNDDLDWTAIDEHDRLTAECPDNAFNEYLFIGIEHGLPAMILFCGIIVISIVISFRNDSIWCYGVVSFAVFALFSYPLHVLQFQILFPILVVACLFSASKSNKTEMAISISTMTVFVSCLTCILVRFLPDLKQQKQVETEWRNIERWHKMEYYEYVAEDCEPLLQHMKHDRNFLFAYGQSLNKIGQYEKSDSILRLGTEISSDPMFWNVMGNNSLALGRYREAEERYKHAFYMVPNRLYPLTLLARLYHAEGDTVRFLDMAAKVEAFVPKIENANTARLRAEIREIREGYNIEAIKSGEEQ